MNGTSPLHKGDPERVSRFRVLARLGEGGMGTVFLGHSRDDGFVALKVVRSELRDDPMFRERFEREIREASRVRSSHVAAAVASDASGKTMFLATEFVPGPTLDEAMQSQGRFSDSETLTFAAGLAAGLAAIHEVGVVHRDLSPRNIIMSPDGPKIVDFGIARQADEATITSAGQSLGTPSWMAPEQVRGQPATAASDVFAWGALTAFVASGVAPFSGARAETVAYRILEDAPDLSSVPDALEPLLRRALDQDIAVRPTSAELVDAFGSFANQMQSGPASASTRRDSDRAIAQAYLGRRRRRTFKRSVFGVLTITLSALLALGVSNAATGGSGPGGGVDGPTSTTTARADDTGGKPTVPINSGHQFRIRTLPGHLAVSEVWTVTGPRHETLHSEVTVTNKEATTVLREVDLTIPKSLAASVATVHFHPEPTSTVRPDPVVRYCLTLRARESRLLSYDITPNGRGALVFRIPVWAHDLHDAITTQSSASFGTHCPVTRPTSTTSTTTTVTTTSTIASASTTTSAATTTTRATRPRNPDAPYVVATGDIVGPVPKACEAWDDFGTSTDHLQPKVGTFTIRAIGRPSGGVANLEVSIDVHDLPGGEVFGLRMQQDLVAHGFVACNQTSNIMKVVADPRGRASYSTPRFGWRVLNTVNDGGVRVVLCPDADCANAYESGPTQLNFG